MDQKQKLLRQEILQKGYDPSKFYQYWQTLDLDFQSIQYQQLKIILETYLQTLSQHEKKEDEQQFDDFQSSEDSGNHERHTVKNYHQQNDIYADFDWDLLMGKGSQKKQQAVRKEETRQNQIKKLPKSFQKKNEEKHQIINAQKQRNTKDKQQKMLSKSTQRQGSNLMKAKQQTKQAKPKIANQVNLIEDLDMSLVNTKMRKLPENSQLEVASNSVEKSFTITFKQLQSELTKQKIKCLKLQQNILNHHKNVQIQIFNVQEVQQQKNLINKLWKGTQYIYTIKTLGRNKNRAIGLSWEVKRKYSDFQWLKSTLLKFYPGIIVPPLPPFPKNKDKIPGQRKKLENFLMDAFRCPQLRNSTYFQIFLSYGNFNDFQGFKKSTQTISKPKQLSNILNMKGQVDLLYGANIQLFSTGIQQYLNKSSAHLKNVKNILNQIKDFYDSISNCYTKLAQVFDLMSRQSCEFSQQKCFPKLTQTYKQISSLISKHSSFCIQEKSNIDTYMISHFSYQKDRIDNMQNLITRKNQFTLQLGKRQPKQESSGMFGKLTGGVSLLFGEKSESLQIPSSNYQKLNKQVGFYNNQLLNEMIRCVQVMIQSQIDHFSSYGISRIDSVDKLQQTWSQIMVELSKLNIQ